MAGLDDVLERLVADPSYRQLLATDPSAALGGYELSEEDRALLASQVTDFAGTGGKVEARASRASMAGLFGALEELADASAELTTISEPDPGTWHQLINTSTGTGHWDGDDATAPSLADPGADLSSAEDGGATASRNWSLMSTGEGNGEGPGDGSPAAGDDVLLSTHDYKPATMGGTGDGSGQDMLIGGGTDYDPGPAAPSGSGYNTWEISLQDTSWRDSSGAVDIHAIAIPKFSEGDGIASDDIVPPLDPSTFPDPIDSISTDDRRESSGPGTAEIFFVETGGGGNVDAPTGGDDGIADVVVGMGDGSDVAKGDSSDFILNVSLDGQLLAATDIAEPEIENVAPAESRNPEPDGALNYDLGDTATHESHHESGIDDLPVGLGGPPTAEPVMPTMSEYSVNLWAGKPLDLELRADASETPGSAGAVHPDSLVGADEEQSAAAILPFLEKDNLYDTPGPAGLAIGELPGGPSQTEDAAQAKPWNEWYEAFNVKGAEPDLEDTPPSDSPGWVYPILPVTEQGSPVVGGGTDAPHDLGEIRITDEGGAGGSAALGGPGTGPVEAGGMEAELYEYPGEYARRFDGVDESAPGNGLDVLIPDHTGHTPDEMVPEDQPIAIRGEADGTAGQGGGIINDSGTMTLADSTLTPSGDTVPDDQRIAVGAGDTELAGSDPVEPATWTHYAAILPYIEEDGDDATARSLADPAPAATDGWVNVGQTEQFLFDNTDIAEPAIEDVAPAESRDPEPNGR